MFFNLENRVNWKECEKKEKLINDWLTGLNLMKRRNIQQCQGPRLESTENLYLSAINSEIVIPFVSIFTWKAKWKRHCLEKEHKFVMPIQRHYVVSISIFPLFLTISQICDPKRFAQSL